MSSILSCCRFVAVFCVAAFTWTSQHAAGANDQEVFEAIVKSTGWLATVKESSYEYECTVRRNSRYEEAGGIAVELVHVYREAFERPSQKFILATTEGFFRGELLKGEYKDELSQVIMTGDASSRARRSLTRPATVLTIPCGQDGVSCLDKSRGWDLAALPVLFRISSPGSDQIELEHVVDFFASGKGTAKRSKVKTQILGTELDVVKHRVLERRKMDIGDPLSVGFDVSIGTSGASEGMVVEISRSLLKPGQNSYDSAEDVHFEMNRVQVKWGTVTNAEGEPVVVPLRIVKISNIGPTETDPAHDAQGAAREDFLFTWTDMQESKWTLPTEAEFEKRLAEDKETVDRILRR